MNLIIFGPPGAGKGTQANLIANKYNLYQLSAGNILRNEGKKSTPLGKKIKEIISNGDMVTDEIINTLIENVIIDPSYKNKIVFDGYPRNISQAKNLENLLIKSNQKINHIFFLNVNKDTIIKRIERRKILEKRSDDDANTILKRYDTYMEITKPVLDFYSSREYFNEINGSQKIEEITSKIEQIIAV